VIEPCHESSRRRPRELEDVVPVPEAELECVFRPMSITDSGASRSLIPEEADHRFRVTPGIMGDSLPDRHR
jgi:ribosome biogenesis SPOUT family RNA methylase Rps3